MNLTTVDEIDNEIRKKEMKIKMNKKVNNDVSIGKRDKKKTDVTDNNDEHEKRKRREMILNLAKMAAKKGIELDGYGKNKNKHKNNKKSNNKKNRREETESDTSSDHRDKKDERDDSGSDSDSVTNCRKEKITIKPKNDKQPADFLFELPTYINKVKSFELLSYKIPETTLIDYSKNTEINITIIDSSGKRNEIASGIVYDHAKCFSEIFVDLRDELNKYGIDVSISDGYLIIKHVKNNKIKIENDINSVFRIFGFDRSEYVNKSNYSSDKKIEHSNAYLFLYKIVNDGPFAKLTEGSNHCEIMKTFENPTRIKHMILQIRKTNDENSDFYDFQGHLPEFVFEFTYL